MKTVTPFRPHYSGHDPGYFDIDTLFWGALIFLALFVSLFLLWKAIQGRGNPTTSDGVAKKKASKGTWDPEIPDPKISWDPEDPEDPWVHSISRALVGHDGAALGPPPMTGAAMNQREREEIFSAARKAREEMQRRRAAREQAPKTQSDS